MRRAPPIRMRAMTPTGPFDSGRAPHGAAADPGRRPDRDRLSLLARFLLCNVAALLWASLSMYLAQGWVADLAGYVGAGPAVVTVLFVAIIPGYLNVLLLVSLAVYRQDPLNMDILFPPV